MISPKDNREKKLRIAFVDYAVEQDKPGITGMSDIVWDMASELINLGHEVHIIATYSTDKYPDQRVIVHNFKTPPIGYRNIIGHFWILARAAKILKRLKPDIIHEPEYLATAFFATVGVREPIVLTVPGNVYQRIQEGHGYEWYFIQVLKWAANVSVKKCRIIIATSIEMKYWWERIGCPPEKIALIPLGYNQKRFHPEANARELLGLPKEKIILLYIGRFSKEKGIIDLVNAIDQAGLQQFVDRLSIYIIGKGPQLAEIENGVRLKGLIPIVKLIDWIDHDKLALWYSAADAVIVPSWYEPFGRVTSESMACGTPVIAANTGAVADHIKNGITGFVFPPRNVKSLARQLRNVVETPEMLRKMRVSVALYAEQNLAWPVLTKKVVKEVYLPIVGFIQSS